MENKDLEQLLELEEIDLFLSKAKEKCEKKLRGKSFAGMEQDDVIQEVLIKVYKSLASYDKSKAKISTYVDRVIENMIKDSFKKCGSFKNLANVNALEIEDSYTSESDDAPSMSHSVSVGNEDLNFLETEIYMDLETNKYLTKRERLVFDLHYRGYEKVEIAQMLGLSKARVTQIWKEIIAKIS